MSIPLSFSLAPRPQRTVGAGVEAVPGQDRFIKGMVSLNARQSHDWYQSAHTLKKQTRQFEGQRKTALIHNDFSICRFCPVCICSFICGSQSIL